MIADPKRKGPCCLAAHTGGDSLENPSTIIPHPLAFSSQKGARAEIFRLALAALTPEEFVEWKSGLGSSSASGNQSGGIVTQEEGGT